MSRFHCSVVLTLVACGTPGSERDTVGSSVSLTSIGNPTAGGDSSGGSEAGSGDEAGESSVGSPKYDVGVGGFCDQRSAGIYCSDNVAMECGDAGDLVDSVDCDPDLCIEGTGCVVCLAGQFHCQGAKVMHCNAAANPPAWQLVEVCDPGAGEGCDQGSGMCEVLQPIGTQNPTGQYFQFADFHTGSSAFLGGYDVDSYEDTIYVLGLNNQIDVYQVQLLDTDGDGKLEPNQHPDNPDTAGPIEGRTLTHLMSLPAFGTPSPSSSELQALEDRLFIGGSALTQYVLANGTTSVVTSPPGWAGTFAELGFDDVHGVWYASNENNRRVFQYDATDGTWGIAFLYPTLAGDHMDGMEVVTDPETNIPYVYVSDMTSDFIGQYRLDPTLGWVQENLFSYAGTSGSLVEGMGFGALHHFWATGGDSLYEVGGGDLSEYTDPPG
ncbi:MAG: hypothetical protein U0168_02440 [Nannocystaceae bacterium]